jgi:hypothetical protein
MMRSRVDLLLLLTNLVGVLPRIAEVVVAFFADSEGWTYILHW